MQKGDKTHEYHLRISEEIPESLAGPSEKAIDQISLIESTSSSHHIITNYDDAVKVLSEVELPNSPTRVATATTGSLTEESNVVIRLHDHQGQSSGTKNKTGEKIEGNVGREREQKLDFKDPGHQRVTTDIVATDKRRRNLISERIRALQALVPNCNKRDTASILSDAIDYIKYLQMQVQTMSTQGLYMFPTIQPRWQAPNLGPPPFPVRPLIGMQQGIPQYGYYAPANIPVYSPPFSGFPPLMPPMEVGSGSSAWRQPSTYIYPQQPHFPSQQQLSVETSSQAGSPVPGQPSSYHVPVTTQSMELFRLALCIVLAVLFIGSRLSAEAATDCNPINLVPCATAILASDAPSETCCGKIKEQRPCLCKYIKNPRLQNFINAPNARKVGDTCGTPFPIC